MKADQIFDIAIIGGGVVGAAIARKLSHFQKTVALIEAGSDIGVGTSKANTAILHTGFDATPGSLESQLLTKSYFLLKDYAAEVGIPLEFTGAIMVAWSQEELDQLPAIQAKAEKNGVTAVQVLSAAEVYTREPHLGPGAMGGLLVIDESIICPFTPPLAFGYEAVANGVELFLNSRVTSVSRRDGHHVIKTLKADYHCQWLINAAGLYSDEIDRLLGHRRFTVTPRRGELIVFDKLARSLIKHIILPIPTKTTKGVLVSPTVFGNILLGPTAENLSNKENSATTPQGLSSLLEKGRKILPQLLEEEVTSTYAGLRAATEHSDYQIFSEKEQSYICVGGIRSTGLSASLGIAHYVFELLEQAGLSFQPKAIIEKIKMPFIGTNRVRPGESDEMIKSNPDYGRIICHCEQVSRGEIRDAQKAVIPAVDLDGLRRRTRCLQGRCQGFYCSATITHLLEEPSERSS